MDSASVNSQLLTSLKENDQKAFVEIYNRYHKNIYLNIRKLVTDESEAQDILQEVFLLFWNSRFTINEFEKIDGWLYSTSYYKSLDYIRKKIRENLSNSQDYSYTLKENDQSQSQIKIAEEEYLNKINYLQSGIECLSSEKRDALILCKVYKLSYEQIGEKMGISNGTVKDYIKSAKKTIKKYMDSNTNLSDCQIWNVQ